MKILHFTTSLDCNAGGTVRALIDLANSLTAIGHTVVVVTADSSPTPPEWLGGGAHPTVIHAGQLRLFGLVFSRPARRLLAREIRGADVVHTHGAWSYANILVCRMAARLGKPYVISLHGMLDAWPMSQKRGKKRLFLALVGTRWLAGASRIHLAAQLEFEQSRRWFPESLGLVIPNLLDMKPFRRLPDAGSVAPMLARLNAARPRVLFLSRLHPKKGLEVLLRAAALLKSRDKPVSVVVAGDGPPEYVAALKTLAKKLGLGDDEVIFLGSVTGEPKLALFRGCDVFALPTHHENFGYVLVEALACGLCAITTRAVAIASELHATGATVIAEATPDEFADAIEELLSDRAALRVRAEAGRLQAFRWFDGEQIIRRYEQMYSGCVGAADARSRSE